MWLYETCTKCLQHLVDLFVRFYAVCTPLLGRVLSLLAGFMRRTHQSLAAVGVAAFVRLVVSVGPSLDQAAWAQVGARVATLLLATHSCTCHRA